VPRRGAPQALARRILEESGYLDLFYLCPRLDLPSLLRRFGLEWHRREFDRLSGALVRLDDGSYHVFTNSRESWTRQRFTAGHELAHYLMHRHLGTILCCRRNANRGIERAANVFARELLMPEEVVRFLWDRGYYAPETIGRILGVSAQAAAIRLEEVMLGQSQIDWN